MAVVEALVVDVRVSLGGTSEPNAGSEIRARQGEPGAKTVPKNYGTLAA
jgi:hypothetical protein